ncbi:hypothetical protein QYE76_051278 [Lolium multiflorum]|uniref:Reverse transcriptase Ty1/copia-type domain-containing protein n=1 Tax=Lolium multiflorum TaxID=4521 RepID=A0AAD8SST3_LOLMU|nr:hypothetical protein QYE76_051278 [Lolium multiflorum]
MATFPTAGSPASSAIVPATNGAPGALPSGSAPRHVGPVVLSFDAGNYTKWAIYMRASLGRAGLIGHVDGTTAAAPTDAAWASADYTVLNVLHAAIDEDVADMVLSRDQTARQLWLAVLELFSANKASKAIYLDFDFRQLVQGASSITEYCRSQKKIADALSENDSPVSDRTLVLNTLRGLAPRFSSAATVISMTDPLPSFLRVRSMLLMEEMQQANAATTAASTALVAQARPQQVACTGPGCRGDSNTGKPKPATKPKGKPAGKQGGAPRAATPAPTGPWMCFSPGVVPWRAPSGPGILGPRPQAHFTAAPTAAPVYQSAPASSSSPTWDNAGLIAALNSLYEQGGWVMDSGATSHMTNDEGNILFSAPLSTPHFVTVGNGSSVPISSSGYTSFRSPSGQIFKLNHHTPTRTATSPPYTRRLDFLFADLQAPSTLAVPRQPPAAAADGSPVPSHDAASSTQAAAPGSGSAATTPDVVTEETRSRAPARGARTPRVPSTPPAVVTTRSGRPVRPRDRLNLCATDSVDKVPTTARQALQDPLWRAAMAAEHKALIDNGTWSLVPRPPRANVVTGKWIFRHKFHSDGSLARRKARWVVRGYSQRPGIDYDETFSPVVKPATIRLVLHLAVSSSWPIRQLDVKNAFLHGTLDEVVYCQQPPGFVDASRPEHVCRLHKSLYGLKQAPRAWYQRFAAYIATMGFVASVTDTSLFVLRSGNDTAYLLLYVDDIIITASTTALLQRLLDRLHSEFAMTDLGDLHYFLGIAVTRSSSGLFLSQKQYATDVLQRAGMAECHPSTTPVDTQAKLSASDGDLLPDGTEYRSLAGALQYLTLTRPDISYAVQQICLHMHAPRTSHLALVKRVLRYVRGTMDFGLHLLASSSTSLTAYSDADWAGCPDSRRSTSGYCIYYGDSLISWSSKRQTTVSRSSAEAEYRAVAHAVAECCWLRQLLQELHRPLATATLVYCDNVSAIYMSSNPVQHRRTKHIEIDIHFVRERVSLGEVRVLHVPSALQFADVMTKGLPSQLFLDFRADDPTDTPGYNKAWLDSVNDHTASEGSMEDVNATLICDSFTPLADLTRDDDEAGPSDTVKDEPTNDDGYKKNKVTDDD